MKRMIMIAVLGLVISISNLFAATADSSAVVYFKYVAYKGDTFEISVFNQEDAEKIVANARAVYAFKVADCNLTVGPNGNTSDHNECFKNSKTGEYAVESWYKKDGKYITSYIIFSLNGARVENTLPEGFEIADYEEIYLVGYGQKAGWSTAKLNGVHNSIVVFIK